MVYAALHMNTINTIKSIYHVEKFIYYQYY